jgi:hypothetical protein
MQPQRVARRTISRTMARVLVVLVFSGLLAVLVARAYAPCVDYWNSRQYRPDTLGASSICVREDPTPVSIALLIGLLAVAITEGARPRVVR